MSRDLTDLPGIGRKSAEKLSELGYETAEDIVVSYLTQPAPIRDALHSVKPLTRYILTAPELELTNADLGVEQPGVFAIPTVAFLYQIDPASESLTRSFSPMFDDPSTLSATDVDWSTGILMNSAHTYGLVYDSVAFDLMPSDDFRRMSVTPTDITRRDDGHVTFANGQARTLIDGGIFETVTHLTNFEYEEDLSRITIHESKNYGVLLGTAGGTHILVAPRTDPSWEE
jgi:hypothetical protein